METETKQEDVAASAPSTNEVVEQTVEQLQAKLKDYESELATVKKERADNTRASQKWQQRAERIDSLEGKLSKIEAMLSSFANVALPDDETRQTYEKRVKDAAPKANPKAEGYQVYLNRTFKKAKLDIDDLPDVVAKAMKEGDDLWMKGDMDKAADVLEDAIDKHKEGLTAKRKEAEDAEQKERETKAKGLVSDRKGSSGSPNRRIYTAEEIDTMPIEEFKKVEADIDLALREGRVRPRK